MLKKDDATDTCATTLAGRRPETRHLEPSLNRLTSLDRLSNRYFAMRHGHSVANQRGIIVSHPENGCAGYGLSEEGVAQVRASLQQDRQLDSSTIILSSDFKRALDTAAMVQQAIAGPVAVEIDTRLRERHFGALELGPDSAYADVWQRDSDDPDSDVHGVESARRVMARVTGLIVDLEQRYTGASLLLVSHGDALQILQTAFARRDASEHRQLQHLQTAEIRPLSLADPAAR
jgi:probable phosphoglycerate mutase